MISPAQRSRLVTLRYRPAVTSLQRPENSVRPMFVRSGRGRTGFLLPECLNRVEPSKGSVAAWLATSSDTRVPLPRWVCLAMIEFIVAALDQGN